MVTQRALQMIQEHKSGLLNMALKQLDGLWEKDLYNITEAKISSRLSKNLLGENIHTKIMEENRTL